MVTERKLHLIPLFKRIRGFFNNNNMNMFYLSISIRALALSFITIFIPLYFLNLGFSLKQVFIFFIIANLIYAFLSFFVFYFMHKFGVIKIMFISVFLNILFYILLFSININNLSIYLIAVVAGFVNCFFWSAYHCYLIKHIDIPKDGEELSTIQIIGSIFASVGPFLGGIILTFFSFKILFFITSLLLITSTFPLFKTKEIFIPKPNFSEIFANKKTSHAFACLGRGIEIKTGDILWPIFIFLSIVSSYEAIGFIFSAAIGGSLIIIYFIGKLTDRYKRKVLKFGTIYFSIIYLTRLAIKTKVGIFFFNLFSHIGGGSVDFPFNSLTYERSKKDISYIIFTELLINLGGALVFLLMIFYPNFIFMFVFSAIATLGYLLFLKK